MEVTGVTLDETLVKVGRKTVTEGVAVNPLDLIKMCQEEHKVKLDLTRVQM